MAAVYPVAAGTPSHSDTYAPEVWSGKTLIKFYKSSTFADISNTDYEGEIRKQGDTVHIRKIPDINITDHAINDDVDYQIPTPEKISLYINKGKKWAYAVDDIQALQSDLNYVTKWTEDAGMQLGVAIDAVVLQDVYSDAHADNVGASAGADTGAINMGSAGTPVELTSENILEWIVDMGVVLDEQSVPDTQRWIVLPPIFCGMIKKSDLKDASLAGDAESIIRNGRLGMIDTFTIYKSRNLNVSSGEHDVMAGHPCAVTFASQLTKNETLKNPKSFGDLIRGLQVFGFETIKPEGLVHSVVSKG